jgi:hypothetical protein
MTAVRRPSLPYTFTEEIAVRVGEDACELSHERVKLDLRADIEVDGQRKVFLSKTPRSLRHHAYSIDETLGPYFNKFLDMRLLQVCRLESQLPRRRGLAGLLGDRAQPHRCGLIGKLGRGISEGLCRDRNSKRSHCLFCGG